jgi:hypothetical protein
LLSFPTPALYYSVSDTGGGYHQPSLFADFFSEMRGCEILKRKAKIPNERLFFLSHSRNFLDEIDETETKKKPGLVPNSDNI